MTIARRMTLSLGLAAGAVVLVAAPALAAPSAQDTTWLKAAHQTNLTEIAAGTAAQSKASSATVKDLGQMFVTDHSAADAKLKAAAQQLGVTLPDTPNAEQQAQLAQASGTSGTAFDALFLTQQIAGHRTALAAGKTEVARGSDAAVLALAKASGAIVQHHLDELLAAQGKSSPTGANAGTGGQAAGAGNSPVGVAVAGLGLVLLVGAGTIVVRRARAEA